MTPVIRYMYLRVGSRGVHAEIAAIRGTCGESDMCKLSSASSNFSSESLSTESDFLSPASSSPSLPSCFSSPPDSAPSSSSSSSSKSSYTRKSVNAYMLEELRSTYWIIDDPDD